MLSWLKAKIIEKNNIGMFNVCKYCVWSNSEEMFNMAKIKHKHFCGRRGKYFTEYSSCKLFEEELFEPKIGATQTEEIEINLEFDTEIDKREIL